MTSVKLINHSSSTADWNKYEIFIYNLLSIVRFDAFGTNDRLPLFRFPSHERFRTDCYCQPTFQGILQPRPDRLTLSILRPEPASGNRGTYNVLDGRIRFRHRGL